MESEQILLNHQVVDSRIAAISNELLSQANHQIIASGIFVTTNLWNEQLQQLQSGKKKLSLTPLQWLELDQLFKRSKLNVPIHEAKETADAANEYLANGIVPIFINDLVYDRLQDRFYAQLQKTAKSALHEAYEVPELHTVTEQQHFFAASVVLPEDFDLFTPISGKHYGKKIQLTVPLKGYWNNTGKKIKSIELDLGDGKVRKLKPDEVIEHEFKKYGKQQLKISITTNDGKKKIAAFTFINAEKAPKPDEHFALWANGKVAAEAWIYWATPNQGKIAKPFLLAEGFPGGRGLDKLWPLVNQADFVNKIRSSGRDFIILGFNDGTLPIQENAYHYRRAVEEIIRRKNNTQKIIAGGASMGGLIARYALCAMENSKIDHQVSVYFTIDTPHEGANIPMSVQALAQFYSKKPCGGAAEGSAKLMASPAAQQMLLQWMPPYPWSRREYPLQSDMRGIFLRELKTLGWMPQKVARRIGVANGTGSGLGNRVPAGAHVFWMGISFDLYANMWASANERREFINMRNSGEVWSWTGGQQSIDSAPGGTRNSWQEVYDGFWFTALRKLYHGGDHCFVPTLSACAINNYNLYAKPDGLPSYLDSYKTSFTNTEHVTLTVELRDFLLKEFATYG